VTRRPEDDELTLLRFVEHLYEGRTPAELAELREHVIEAVMMSPSQVPVAVQAAVERIYIRAMATDVCKYCGWDIDRQADDGWLDIRPSIEDAGYCAMSPYGSHLPERPEVPV
jgi:hypothetical protein